MSHTIFRVLFSGIFIVAGGNHLLKPEHVSARLEAAPLGWIATSVASAELLVLLAGGVLLAAGLALLVGLRTRLAAVVLIGVLVPITLTVQVGSVERLGPLFKNIALLGGLIHLAVVGAGGTSLDALLGRRS